MDKRPPTEYDEYLLSFESLDETSLRSVELWFFEQYSAAADLFQHSVTLKSMVLLKP